jgi:hypothetical protein
METNQIKGQEKKSPTDIAINLKNCLLELDNLVMRDNNPLDNYKLDEVLRIIPIKLEVLEQIENYETELKETLQKDHLNKEVKNTLIEAHLKLCDTLAMNYSKLDVAKSLNQKIMNMISNRLIENKKQDHIYDSSGEIVSERDEYNYMPPLTLNQKV